MKVITLHENGTHESRDQMQEFQFNIADWK